MKEIRLDEFIIGDKLNVVVYMGNIFKLIDVNIFVCVEGKEKNVFGRILKMIFEIVIFKKKK